jgi:tetratricopeptide (TPR) repeat protein
VSVPSSPPVRVDKALGLLPDLEALAPLRDLLVSIARPDEGALWSSSGPYLTLGMRGVQPDELARRMPQAFHRITEHLQGLYKAYVTALECEQRGDGAGVARARLHAGRLEEGVRRLSQARAWFDVARSVSETLQDRRPEVESLRALGQLWLAIGDYAEGARHFQRALALAEAEFDQAGAIAACQGLGDAALWQGQWPGAHAWYAQGLRLAEASSDRPSLGRLERQLSVLARRQRDLAAAGDHLRRAREWLEGGGPPPPEEMARVLSAQGQLEAQLGRRSQAGAAYREALAWARRAPPDLGLELVIRLGLAGLLVEAARPLEAEEEMRRAEQVAIAGNLTHGLAQVYTLMGTLKGRQQDETGFVFFEQAIALCRTLDRPSTAEAQVYLEYGLFREQVGQVDEARAYLERAREIFASAGETGDRERAEAELQKMSA